MTSRVGEVTGEATSRWQRIKQRNPWLVHAIRAYQRFGTNNGNYYAAAITFFSFTALFPLLLLAVSILGFVLHSNPDLMTKLLNKVSEQAPGALGDTLKSSIQTAVGSRTGIGLVGLGGVALTGSGWIANLRAAVTGVWGHPPVSRNFLVAVVMNLLVLLGLGLALIVSLGITAGASAATDKVLTLVGLENAPGVHVLLKVVGFLLAVAGDMLIFAWILVVLPGADIPRIVVIRGTLIASIGFEILKVAGTYTIARSAHSATAGPFAGILAILIWIQLVSRFMLYCAAWMATAEIISAEQASSARVSLVKQLAGAAVEEDDRPGGVLTPAGVAGTLLGAGAVAGSAATLWARHRLRSVRDGGAAGARSAARERPAARPPR